MLLGMTETQAPALPDNFEKLSSRPKVACYLATVVGEGKRFTMGQVRTALPNVNQIDRRTRELREYGWTIHNYRDYVGLRPEEYLLEKVGDRIWEPTYKSSKKSGVSATVRRQVHDRDKNRCLVCGIGKGEEYPEYPGRKARLTIGHYVPKERGGTDDPSNLRTECAICNEPSKNMTETPVDTNLVKAQIKSLGRKEREQLMQWVLADRRSFSKVENVWAEYSRLPGPSQDEMKSLLADLMGS